MEKKLENLMHDKTNYTNHLKPYFDNLTIRQLGAQSVLYGYFPALKKVFSSAGKDYSAFIATVHPLRCTSRHRG